MPPFYVSTSLLSSLLFSSPLNSTPNSFNPFSTKMMGVFNDKRALRAFRTFFFLITMIISFLFFSVPILLAVADLLLPSALLTASLSSPLDHPTFSFLQTLSSHFTNYDYRYSLIDIPIISIIRSAIILCVYGFCDGPGLSTGPYLGITTVCSVASLLFVSVKASYVFGGGSGGGVGATEVALFVCSPALAIGHIVVAYRTSCRERRKLLVYKIDIEAVSTFKNGFKRYSKILQDARVKVKLQN